jgi:hypothetical protein
VSTEGYGTALTSVVALLALAGCARVIGLGNDYYEVAGEVAAGGASGAGVSGTSGTGGANTPDAGNGGTLDGGGLVDGGGTGGVGGTPDGPICSEHAITAKSTWVASASSHQNGSPASNLTDNTSARWSTGKPQSGDEWLQIDFGQTVYVRRVNLQQGADANDYPRMYTLSVSDVDNNLTGSALASGVGSSGVTTTIELPKPFAGRYLLIKQLGSSLSWWSVEEIEVVCFDGSLGSISPPT